MQQDEHNSGSADATRLRERAARARRLANTLTDPADKERLLEYARELDEQADRIEGVARA
jgi:hypothetical protein